MWDAGPSTFTENKLNPNKRKLNIMKSLAALIIVAFLASGYKAEQGNECPRYSAEEFKASVFDPVFKRDLTAMKKSFDLGVEGVTEILERLQGEKSSFSSDDLASIGTSESFNLNKSINNFLWAIHNLSVFSFSRCQSNGVQAGTRLDGFQDDHGCHLGWAQSWASTG